MRIQINVLNCWLHSLFCNKRMDFFYVISLLQILTALLVQLERRCQLITSGVLFVFWLLYLCCNIIPLYTYVEIEVRASSIDCYICFVTLSNSIDWWNRGESFLLWLLYLFCYVIELHRLVKQRWELPSLAVISVLLSNQTPVRWKWRRDHPQLFGCRGKEHVKITLMTLPPPPGTLKIAFLKTPAIPALFRPPLLFISMSFSDQIL